MLKATFHVRGLRSIEPWCGIGGCVHISTAGNFQGNRMEPVTIGRIDPKENNLLEWSDVPLWFYNSYSFGHSAVLRTFKQFKAALLSDWLNIDVLIRCSRPAPWFLWLWGSCNGFCSPIVAMSRESKAFPDGLDIGSGVRVLLLDHCNGI